MLKEFRAFALRGNLLELAAAFILGVAFATVVTSLVEAVIMPLIAAIIGQPNFNSLSLELGESEIKYGTFLTAVANFLLIAFVLFLIIRAFTKLQRPAAATDEPVKMRECPQCLSLIPEKARRCSACTSEVGATA